MWPVNTARLIAEAAAADADARAAAATDALRRTVRALAGADAGSRSIAHRALAHALMHGGRVDEALTELGRALRFARDSGEPELASQVQLKRAHGLLLAGRLNGALRAAGAALDRIADDPVLAARALGTRALIRREQGHFAAALDDLDAAVAGLRKLDDELGLQRALVNRALVKCDMHVAVPAIADLAEAEGLARAGGRDAAIGLIAANLGYAASQSGDVPEALSHYERAERIFRQQGMQLGGLHLDRAELLARVGLADEAAASAAAALTAFEVEGRSLRVPEARLLLARIALRLGEPARSLVEGRLARSAFRRQGRVAWAAAAGLEVAAASERLGRPRRRQALASDADTLAEAGWTPLAIEAWLLLEDWPAAARHRRDAQPAVRANAWYAQARLLDDPRAAAGAVRRGLAALDQNLATVAADDVRASMAADRLRLAGLGVDLALADGRSRTLFAAVERARAVVVVRDVVRPLADPALTDALRRLGRATSAVERADLARVVTQRSRIRRASGRVAGPVRLADLDAMLGGRLLVVWFVRQGRLHALTRLDGRTRRRRSVPETAVRGALERVLFAVRRLSGAGRGDDDRVRGLLAAAAEELSALLCGDLPDLAAVDPVLVPPAFLHAVPWHELPATAARPVTVAASVRQWLIAAGSTAGHDRSLVAAGPGLPGARAEAEAIAGGYGVRSLIGQAATVERVLDALANADLAHLATHGRLRPDNPQFSELTLADGALLVHHLDTLDALPATMVLASCDSGRPITRPGEALLGFAAACLVRGTRTLIAPVAPVPDGSTQQVMTTLHELLRAGVTPAQALAAAQSHEPPGRRAFVCFGAG